MNAAPDPGVPLHSTEVRIPGPPPLILAVTGVLLFVAFLLWLHSPLKWAGFALAAVLVLLGIRPALKRQQWTLFSEGIERAGEDFLPWAGVLEMQALGRSLRCQLAANAQPIQVWMKDPAETSGVALLAWSLRGQLSAAAWTAFAAGNTDSARIMDAVHTWERAFPGETPVVQALEKGFVVLLEGNYWFFPETEVQPAPPRPGQGSFAPPPPPPVRQGQYLYVLPLRRMAAALLAASDHSALLAFARQYAAHAAPDPELHETERLLWETQP